MSRNKSNKKAKCYTPVVHGQLFNDPNYLTRKQRRELKRQEKELENIAVEVKKQTKFQEFWNGLINIFKKRK